MQNAKILIPAGKNLMHYKINNTYIYTHTHTHAHRDKMQKMMMMIELFTWKVKKNMH